MRLSTVTYIQAVAFLFISWGVAQFVYWKIAVILSALNLLAAVGWSACIFMRIHPTLHLTGR